MKIAVLGGGNIGTLLAAELAQNNEVTLFTSKVTDNNLIEVYDNDEKLLYKSRINLITDNMELALQGAEVVFSTFPTNVYCSYVEKIVKYIANDAYLMLIPGTGGKEYITKSATNKNITIVGFQRVHSIARLKEKNKSVYMLGKKNTLYVSTVPNNKKDNAKEVVEKLFKIKTVAVDNYLSVTLTPSNPILHTTRLYDIFRDKKLFEREVLFYEEWTNSSSEILFKCDEELQMLCKSLKELNLTEVVSLKKYYESDNDATKFTEKLRSIQSFKGIKTPMIKVDNGYIPDYNSRYFMEDFPYGLLIIKAFSVICEIETPNIDKVLNWFQTIENKEYLVEGNLTGKDIQETGIPQNYNIKTVNDIYEFYK